MRSKDDIFKRHYDYYKTVGVETIKQQSGQVDQVSSDYQGRVIYELLQNAFDKAKGKVRVEILGDSLFVANDGERFTYISDYNYNGFSERGDFQSLCSISTSTKTTEKSIGNKGVGFKSAFSIAKNGYVNVYTNGIIRSSEGDFEELISFRIYDAFRELGSIPTELEDSVAENLRFKIELVQKERKDRGVPGYYFPIHLLEEPAVIQSYFERGYVTIVEIPLANKEAAIHLIEEIKPIHFQFVSLRYHSSFEIEFLVDGNVEFKKEVAKESSELFSASIKSEDLRKKAIEAGLDIKEPKVAFYIKEDENGLLYNYLPTKIKSPFSFIDFHADFHTTVDRTTINFEGKIGEYNQALLQACIELYFIVLVKYADNVEISLNNEYIFEFNGVQNRTFDWRFLDVKNADVIFHFVRRILGISDGHYYNACHLVGNIAKNFFEVDGKDKHRYFFDVLSRFIHQFSWQSNKEYKWIGQFSEQMGSHLKQLEAQVIPNVFINADTELLYRETAEKEIKIPEGFGVQTTTFRIENEALKKALNVKNFNDFNEVIKYFKQCSFTGKISEERLNEDQQKEILNSLLEIFNARRETNVEFCTHRFTKAYNTDLRDKNSAANQANFNVSTIFLKTIAGRYKPAQTCNESELDFGLLPKMDKETRRNFLNFLGVSTNSEYKFSDIRLYQVFEEGIDHIPKPIGLHEDRISGDLLKNIFLISSQGKMRHPALINYNNYSVLESISDKYAKNELRNLLVGDYDRFPTEYLEILQQRLVEKISVKSEITTLYQSLFLVFHHLKKYLVVHNNSLSWISDTDFVILRSKENYLTFSKKTNQRVLCFYQGSNIPEELSSKVLEPKDGKIVDTFPVEDSDLKVLLEKRMIYLLVSISLSTESESNYLDEGNLSKIQDRLNGASFFNTSNLQQEQSYGDSDAILLDKKFAIDRDRNVLYFNENCSKKDKAEGIGIWLFENTRIFERIELILFYKEEKDLQEEFEMEHIDVIRRKWKPDFSRKFEAFQQEVLQHFVDKVEMPKHWWIYDQNNQSEVLIKVELAGKLNVLKELINRTKLETEFEGYFDFFELEIVRNHIEKKAAEILAFIENIKEPFEIDSVTERVKYLSRKLGSEKVLDDIFENLKAQFIHNVTTNIQDEKNRQLTIERRCLEIGSKFSDFSRSVSSIKISDNTSQTVITPNKKKTILQGIAGNIQDSEDLESIGASGEEEVLICVIREFLKLDILERRVGIDATYELLKRKLGNDSHESYRDECLSVIEDDEKLRLALIPLFYVTMHHKYSYFDLIAYLNKRPTIIEVKTTKTRGNNKFIISIAEVNAARSDENYEIVRVDPFSIVFLGNPIKSLESKLTQVEGEQMTLIPRNYEFNFLNHA